MKIYKSVNQCMEKILENMAGKQYVEKLKSKRIYLEMRRQQDKANIRLRIKLMAELKNIAYQQLKPDDLTLNADLVIGDWKITVALRCVTI